MAIKDQTACGICGDMMSDQIVSHHTSIGSVKIDTGVKG